MRASLLHRNMSYALDTDPDPEIDLDKYGNWTKSQDPLTGQVVRVWQPFPDLPSTPNVNESVTYATFPCIARGIVDGGIRVAGTTERFGDTYENIDFVKMWTPPHIMISKRDRVTNIKDPRGHIMWADEEFNDRMAEVPAPPRATVFNVNGVTPLFNAFNRHTENFVLLERAEVVA